LRGTGRFGELLDTVPPGTGGVHVLVDDTDALESEAPGAGLPPGEPSGFWFHLGYTGPAIFYRPEDRLCIGLLAHRAGPDGELLDAGRLQARRMGILERWLRP
jgi:hypothetical protein